MAVKTKIIKIGNSQGVRIPKSFLAQLNFPTDIEIDIRNDGLILRPIAAARQGWDTAFATMAQAGDDALLDDNTLSRWDETEWEW